MRQRISHFLVVLLLMFSGKIFGQNKAVSHLSINHMGYQRPPESFKPGRFSTRHFLGYNDCAQSREKFILTNPVSASCYINNLGLICKTELKLDKITPMPFRFRLGSLEYVNWMERKPNTAKPY